MKLLLALLGAVIVAGCYMPSPKPTRTEKLAKAIDIAEAESAEVTIAMGVGKLRLAGGSERLLDAEFEYNLADWTPEVSYEVKDGLGRLLVEQPSRVVGATWPGNVRYDWNLKLSDKLPLELKIDMGVGKTELDLRGLNLTRLDIDAGVGEGMIDLSGTRQRDLEADIEAGIGKVTLILPREIGTRVEVDGAIGKIKASELSQRDDEYVNDAWGKTSTSLRVDIEGGIGEITLKLADSVSD